ncbi:IPT/TIG domain-containing protein [Dysgonomonas alginatilytica]|uniref:IPT/TIG domain-containing protein n=1 Tax=Dysgonomonas alginatilytica TaxID=1605892 RepID=A0A2V3PSQ7_9BACT|nr:IPT/TIG domain-containing protein [Dysgonomonas alginatilytica]PXV68757.1 IPT/TIG domain-containing protein [Dysgonomonas alginatilytica]
MKNTNIFFKAVYILSFFLLACTSCNENLVEDATNTSAPNITDFSPKSGKVGTEIKITGENLLKLDTIYIGGGMATVKYLINSREAVATVTSTSKTGKLKVSGVYGAFESSDVFTVTYVAPVINMSTFPSEGKANDNVLIEGTDMDAVIEVYFETTKAEIITQTTTELIVKVPYFEENNVDVFLSYNTESGVKKTGTTGKPFSLDKPQPTVESYDKSAEVGETIIIKGTNLSLVDKVMFDKKEATISLKEDKSISVIVPSGYTATSKAVLKLIYYVDRELIVTSDFQVIVPQINYWPDVTLFANDVTTTDNFFNAMSGKIYNPCNYSGNAKNVYFYLTITSTSLAFNNPRNGINQIKNFKCENVALPSDTVGTLNVKFRRMDPTNSADNIFIEKVKNKTLTSISQAELEEAGVIKAGTSSFRHNGVPGDPNNMYSVGDIILFQHYNTTNLTNTTAPIIGTGFLEVVKITSKDPKTDKTSSVTFNCYFQK